MDETMRHNMVNHEEVVGPDAVMEKVGIAAVMVQVISGKHTNN